MFKFTNLVQHDAFHSIPHDLGPEIAGELDLVLAPGRESRPAIRITLLFQ